MEAQKRYTNRFVCSPDNVKFADVLDICYSICNAEMLRVFHMSIMLPTRLYVTAI